MTDLNTFNPSPAAMILRARPTAGTALMVQPPEPSHNGMVVQVDLSERACTDTMIVLRLPVAATGRVVAIEDSRGTVLLGVNPGGDVYVSPEWEDRLDDLAKAWWNAVGCVLKEMSPYINATWGEKPDMLRLQDVAERVVAACEPNGAGGCWEFDPGTAPANLFGQLLSALGITVEDWDAGRRQRRPDRDGLSGPDNDDRHLTEGEHGEHDQ